MCCRETIDAYIKIYTDDIDLEMLEVALEYNMSVHKFLFQKRANKFRKWFKFMPDSLVYRLEDYFLMDNRPLFDIAACKRLASAEKRINKLMAIRTVFQNHNAIELSYSDYMELFTPAMLTKNHLDD